MRFWKVFIFCLLGAGLAGCKPQTPATSGPTAGKPTDAELAVTIDEDVQVVQVAANDTMHFNGNRFTVHAGKPVRIELKNAGHAPRDQMAHNFVVLQPGTDVTVFNLMSAQAKSTAYIPPDQAGSVLAFTPLAGPGETVQVQFLAPPPGEYAFLCNFPGHFAAGMRGIMTVSP